ncbi:MAG: glycosyltransferase family 4 protein, partial [Acidimicrobiia bacterium]
VRLFYFAAGMRLVRIVRKENCRHIHAHFLDLTSDVAMLASEFDRRVRADGVTWSVTVHGPFDFLERREMKPWYKVDSASFVVCISDFGRSMLLSRLGHDLWDKLIVVHCGLNLPAVAVASQSPSGTNRIVCTGRLVGPKGQRVLLDAVCLLRERGVDVELRFIGEGPDRPELEDAISRFALSDRVVLLGAKPAHEVLEEVRHADVFCLPSFAEGIPIALMEAMAIGTPVVTTNVFGIPELVSDRVSGRLVRPGRADQLADALVEVLTDAEARQRYVAAGIETVQREFDVEHSAATLSALFRDVIAGRVVRRSVAGPTVVTQATDTGASSTPAKVLMVLSSLRVGGAERVLMTLLPELRGQGVEPTLCTLTAEHDSYIAKSLAEDGFARVNLGAARLLDPFAMVRFRRAVRAGRFDVVHAQDTYGAMLAGLAAPRGTKVVVTRHTLGETETGLRAVAKDRLLNWVLRHRAMTVVAVSDAVRRTLTAAGVEDDKIVTIFNGIDLTRFAPLSEAPELRRGFRDELGVEPDTVLVTAVAVLRPFKGHDTLLEAWPKVSAQFPEALLLIVGDGPLRGEIEALAAPMGDTVRFLGERDDIPRVMAGSDVMVSASKREALPTVLLEAAAAGSTIVACDVGGTSEIVSDEVSALLMPANEPQMLADALNRVLADSQLRERLRLAAHDDVVARFSPHHHAEMTAALYARLTR